MYSWFVKLSLLVGLFGSSTIAQSNRTCMPGVMDTPGYTTPSGTITLSYGSPLEIYCTLNMYHSVAKNHTADDLTFVRGGETIDKKYVSVVNETTARLYMKSIPVTNDVKYYYCYLEVRHNNKVPPPANTNAPDRSQTQTMLVCLNTVEIGAKPQNIDRFSCVSRNLEILNCTWREPNNGVPTQYLAYYLIVGNKDDDNQWYKCPVYKKGTCQWTIRTNPPYVTDSEEVYFRIDGSNKFGNNSQMIRFNHYSNVIPDRPSKLVATSFTSHSVHLKWNIGTLKNFDKRLVYKLNYTWYLPEFWYDEAGYKNIENPNIRNLSLQWNVKLYNASDVEQISDEIRVNVTNLPYPNVGYQFKIEMKSAVADDNYWSDPAFVNVRTKPCPPYRSPETDVAGFTIFSQSEDYRDVFVYWKEIPEEEHNADGFKLEIGAFENNIKSNILPQSVNNSSAIYTNLTLNSYEFVINSINAYGSAPYSTSVHLPQQIDILPQFSSFTIMDLDDGKYQLLWESPKAYVDIKLTNITVYWCENDQSFPAPCSNSLQWIHLPATAVDHNLVMKPNATPSIAISVNSVNSTSGMLWAQCTVPRYRQTTMSNVEVVQVGTNFIELHWRLECSERNPDIIGYDVTYCPLNNTDSKTCAEPYGSYLIRGDLTTNRVTLAHLRPYTNYLLTVSSLTNKLVGLPSKEMYTRTLQAAPDMKDVQVQILNITNSSAVVKWNKPSNLNGILHYYDVSYDNKTLITNDTTVMLTGLRTYEEYEIIVTACTVSCSQTHPVQFRTSIGFPGEPTNVRHQNDASGGMRVKWKPPERLAGPKPVYEVKIIFDENSPSTFEQFESSETEMFVGNPCAGNNSYSSSTLFVRAKNIDDSDTNNVKYYFGPWTRAYTVDCQSKFWIKFFVSFGSFLLFVLLTAYFVSMAMHKLRKMRDVQVVLPEKFETVLRKQANNASENNNLSIDSDSVDNRDEDSEDDLISFNNTIYLNPCYDKNIVGFPDTRFQRNRMR